MAPKVSLNAGTAKRRSRLAPKASSKDGVDPVLWEMGIVAPWYAHPYQLPVYQELRSTRDPFFEATRRFGKTTTELLINIEDCLIQPERVVRWCEPWKDQARNIVIPELMKIVQTCPAHLSPRFYRTDSFFEFPKTGSRIYLLGVNEDRGETARGNSAHRVVRDEYGSWKHAKYISMEVLMPLLLTTQGQMSTIATPPEDLDHDYYLQKAEALRSGRLIQRDFDTITTLSPEEKERFVISMGGRASTAVKRELYLEAISDPERLVIPEYDPSRHDIEDDHPRPEYFDTYVGMDFGVADNTAGLFGYVDFEKRTLVIEDELWLLGKNTAVITQEAKSKELDLWKKIGPDGIIHPPKPFQRWGDNDLQTLLDMNQLHGYLVNATEKHDKMDWINSLRLLFGDGRIKIKKRCVNLLYQLKVGLWNERKSDFQRGEKIGHLDLLAALIYLFRNISWTHNPFPQNVGVSIYTHFIPDTVSQSKDEQAFDAILDPMREVMSEF